jgi:aspartokinase/homoserine dehydrogenase 1
MVTYINATLLADLHSKGENVNSFDRLSERAVWLDARDVLVLARAGKDPTPDFNLSQQKFDHWRHSSVEISTAKILVITGYIASTATGIPTTLGRDGSDYSASIFAALLKSNSVVIWTDVDGVYSANPLQVKEAVLLDELSYDEASELAYFGAKVLHPKTMTPVFVHEIPIWIKNTFNPSYQGTVIHSMRKAQPLSASTHINYGVKGLSEIGNLTLIKVEGTGMIGVPGVANRLFSALKTASVSVVLITQAGSEHSICFALPTAQSEIGLAVVSREFRDELERKELQTVEKSGPVACLAVVGDGMRSRRGVAGKVFTALADAGVNIQAIAQGSSERNISVIIAQSDVQRGLLAVHSALFLPSAEKLSLPKVQSLSSITVLTQHIILNLALIKDSSWSDDDYTALKSKLSQSWGERKEVKLNIIAEVDYDKQLMQLNSNQHKFDLGELTNFLLRNTNIKELNYPLIIDCTESEVLIRHYRQWKQSKILLVSQAKVEAALSSISNNIPIISTIRSLQSSQLITKIEAILPCELSFAFTSPATIKRFNLLKESKSQLDKQLQAIAFELGYELKTRDILYEQPFAQFSSDVDIANELEKLRNLAAASDKHYQYIATMSIMNHSLQCGVALRLLAFSHPFAWLRGYNSVIAIHTQQVPAHPVILQTPVDMDKYYQIQEVQSISKYSHTLAQLAQLVSQLAL